MPRCQPYWSISLSFLVISVLATTAAELAELQPVRRSLFILSRNVIAIFAIVTLKHNIIAWHKSPSPLVARQ